MGIRVPRETGPLVTDYTKMARDLLRLPDGANDERVDDIACTLERVVLEARIDVWKNLPWITGHNAHKTWIGLTEMNLTQLRAWLAELDRKEMARAKNVGL